MTSPRPYYAQYADTLLMPPTDEYYPWERRWLHTPDTIPRYMRAAKWNLADGKKRITATLEWRREFKPDLIPPDEVKIESETGKMCESLRLHLSSDAVFINLIAPLNVQHYQWLRQGRPADYLHAPRTREHGNKSAATAASRMVSVRLLPFAHFS